MISLGLDPMQGKYMLLYYRCQMLGGGGGKFYISNAHILRLHKCRFGPVAG